MKLYLATWLEDDQGNTLTHIEYEDRLLSFFMLQNKKHDEIIEYLTTGKIVDKKRSLS